MNKSGTDENSHTFWIDLTDPGASVPPGTPCSNDQNYFIPAPPTTNADAQGFNAIFEESQELGTVVSTLTAHIDSHTFMTSKPFWKVWKAYKAFLNRLDPPSQNPDPVDPNTP